VPATTKRAKSFLASQDPALKAELLSPDCSADPCIWAVVYRPVDDDASSELRHDSMWFGMNLAEALFGSRFGCKEFLVFPLEDGTVIRFMAPFPPERVPDEKHDRWNLEAGYRSADYAKLLGSEMSRAEATRTVEAETARRAGTTD